VSFASLLISTCTVQRYTDGATDAYGNKARTWADHLTDQPGRISYPKGRQIQRGTEITPVDAVLFTEDIDVLLSDRVVVDGTAWEVLFVADLQDATGDHHKEISLKRVIE
jgi:hypothetical protein